MKEKQQIKILHEALNNLLPLYIWSHGWDCYAVDQAIKALKINKGKLPITGSLLKEYGGKI